MDDPSTSEALALSQSSSSATTRSITRKRKAIDTTDPAERVEQAVSSSSAKASSSVAPIPIVHPNAVVGCMAETNLVRELPQALTPASSNAPRKSWLTSDSDPTASTSPEIWPDHASNPLSSSDELLDRKSPKRQRTEHHHYHHHNHHRVQPDSITSEQSRRLSRKGAFQNLPPLRIGTDEEDVGKVLHSSRTLPSSGTLKPRFTQSPPPYTANPLTSTTFVPTKTVYLPPVSPIISRQTLKELDLHVILTNRQLRHDLLFDSSLQFRPTPSHSKRLHADLYWSAVTRELETGCTCVSFDLNYRPLPVTCVCRTAFNVDSFDPDQPAMCYWPAKQVVTAFTPPRLQILLQEFLEVILFVIQPAKESKKGSLRQASPQWGFEDEAAHLRSIFDPALISQEIRNASFDPSGLMTEIGMLLKDHCAPMRDGVVDAMVSVALKCKPGAGGTKADAIRAVRMCMDLLELMKLDLANHELQALRPFLTRTAGTFELDAFKKTFKGDKPLPDLTRTWLQTTHQSLLAREQPINHPALGQIQYDQLTVKHQMLVVAIKGFVDLILDASAPYSLPTPSPSPVSIAHEWTVQPLPGFPETTYLDNYRMTALSAAASDALVMSMLILLYRQLIISSPSTAKSLPRRVENGNVLKLKEELRAIRREQSTPVQSPSSPQANTPTSLTRGLSSDDMHDLILHIVAQATKDTSFSSSASHSITNPDKDLLRIACSWADVNLYPHSSSSPRSSALSTIIRDRLKNWVFDVTISIACTSHDRNLGQTVPGIDYSSVAPGGKTKNVPPAGLEHMSVEVQNLAQHIAKLARIHCNAYQPLYDAEEALKVSP